MAAETAADGGIDHTVCAKFEERVMELVAAYGNHKFATTLEEAAPNLFTFLRHPGMLPSTTTPSATYAMQWSYSARFAAGSSLPGAGTSFQ